MFSGCTLLEKAPELPGENLTEECYLEMFSGCTSLKKAPELPANSLAKGCYSQMFYGCTSLSEITILATDIDESQCTRWLNKTSLSGTFYKNKNATWRNDGIIPQGWTIKLIDPQK